MMRRFSAMILAATGLAFNIAVHAEVPTAHGREFWRAIIADQYRLPAGESPMALATELTGYVTSSDAELRDSFGYEILANWIHRSGKFSPADLQVLSRQLTPHLLLGLGEVEGDRVFRRSFALLNLKELAAADLTTPFLSQADFDELLAISLRAMAGERDLRGYVEGKGWAHATAHGADMLRILARNVKLRPPQQAAIVRAVVERLRSAGIVFVWGEDARLAAALASVMNRADVDAAPFNAWFAQMFDEHAALWAGTFDTAKFIRLRAQANTLAQLAALLARQNNAALPPALREGVNKTLARVN